MPQQYKEKSLSACIGQQNLELRNIDSDQNGTKSILDYMKSNCRKVYKEIHHNVKCRNMAGQKCQHMPKILSTELLAKECKTVYNKKCEHIPRSPAWSC